MRYLSFEASRPKDAPTAPLGVAKKARVLRICRKLPHHQQGDRTQRLSIVFLMIGGGKHFEDLAKAVKARGLENSFRFRPYQERAMLPLVGIADAHWLSLRPALEGLIVPSKFYAVAAAGKPMLMIGDSEGEIGRLIREHCCGTIVRPGDAATLADTLRSWSEQTKSIAEMGAQARQMLDARFTRRRAFDQWRRLIGQPASRSQSD